MATHSSTLTWKIPWTEEPGGLQSMGVAKSWTWLSDFTFTFHFSLSCIGGGNGNPLQCSCLENPRDGGAWGAAVYGVAQSQTRLKWLSSSSSSQHFNTISFFFLFQGKEPHPRHHSMRFLTSLYWVLLLTFGGQGCYSFSFLFFQCLPLGLAHCVHMLFF